MLPRVVPGQEFTGTLFNRVIDAVNEKAVTVAPPLQAMHGPYGTVLSFARSYASLHLFTMYDLAGKTSDGVSYYNARRVFLDGEDYTVDTQNSETIYNRMGVSVTPGSTLLHPAFFDTNTGRWELLPVKPTMAFKNTTNETMPAHGVAMATGIVNGVVQVVKNTIANAYAYPRHEYIVNLGGDVPYNETGTCVWMRDISPEHPVRVLYHYSSGSSPVPAYGEVWGPWFDSWAIARGMPGLVILGDVDTDTDSGGPDTDDKTVTVKAQPDGDAEFLSRYVQQAGEPATIPARSVIFPYTPRAGNITTEVYLDGNAALGQSVVSVNQRLPVFTGPVQVANTTAGNGYFQGELGIAKPIIVTVASASSSHGAAAFDTVGPIAGKQALYKGLPGFKVLGTVTGDGTQCVVIRDPTRYGWCKVYSAWTRSGEAATVTVQACTDSGGLVVYDGSAAYLPLVQFDVTIFCRGQDPLLAVGDTFQYRFEKTTSTHAALPVGDVLGPRLGTVAEWSGSIANIPKFWALMDGTANSVANGGSGYDLRGRFVVGYDGRGSGTVPAHSDSAYNVGATGGSKDVSHSTAVGTHFTGTGSKYLDHDNRPPWFCLAKIERIR